MLLLCESKYAHTHATSNINDERFDGVLIDLSPVNSVFRASAGGYSIHRTGNRIVSHPVISSHLEEDTLFLYKCSDYYAPTSEGGLLWNDPALGIEWGVTEAIISSKDAVQPTLAQLDSPF